MKKFMEWFKNNYELLVKGFLTVITVLFGIAANVFDSGPVKSVVDIGFYVTFSLEMLVVMWDFNKIGKNVLELQKKIKQGECIYFNKSAKAGEQQKASKLIEETSAGSIYIICYGTHLYGNLINDAITNIKDNNKKIRINAIVCSPYSTFLSGRKDESDSLCVNIDYCLQNSSYFNSVYLLQKPKTYRACMIKNKKGKAIYASFQTYIISEGRFLSTKDSRTPIISACENNDDVLGKIEDFLDKEWKDIQDKKEGKDFIKIIEDGKPVCGSEIKKFIRDGKPVYDNEFFEKTPEVIC